MTRSRRMGHAARRLELSKDSRLSFSVREQVSRRVHLAESKIVLVLVVPTSLTNRSGGRSSKSFVGQAVLVLEDLRRFRRLERHAGLRLCIALVVWEMA